MSISCGCDFDGDGWWYITPEDFSILNTKRKRKCCSCGGSVQVGDTVAKFSRAKNPENDVEERIYGGEVPLAPWFMCEECGGLFMALSELGFCVNLSQGESMRDLVKQSRGGE